MHYPWWYVPVLTSPMLIALIAVIHVLVSHYAVGGGILLALENRYARRTGDRRYLDYWHKHAKFFVLLTVAFGAITGVGIWWTIGLASPLATQTLIRIFVFGWATEWVFFIVEIVAAFAMYYYWNRLPDKTHTTIAWIYALAAWISLVLITGITAFMLNANSLIAGADWVQTGSFWGAFFNVQFLPQTLLRTGGALFLATLYVYLHASITLRKPGDADLLEKVVRRLRTPLLAGLLLIAVGVGGWFVHLPESALLSVQRAAVLNVFLGVMAGLGGIITLMALAVCFVFPRSMNPGFAATLFLMGLMLFAIGEFVREAVRKPYIVDQIVLGNQIYVSEVDACREKGLFDKGEWIKHAQYYVWYETADHMPPEPGTPEAKRYAEERRATFLRRDVDYGHAIFLHHCNDCHALDIGYSAVGPLLVGLSKEQIAEKVKHLNEPVINMPPWCGNDEEAEWLAEFLVGVRPEKP